jgi:acyl-CoA reductase-like NAD-dependent aldehyde dehydrogenase
MVRWPVDAVLGEATLAATTGDAIALDRVIGELRNGEQAWARTPLAGRHDLLLELSETARREAGSWVEVAAHVKGLDRASALIGEEWLGGPYALWSSVSALAEAASEPRPQKPITSELGGVSPVIVDK